MSEINQTPHFVNPKSENEGTKYELFINLAIVNELFNNLALDTYDVSALTEDFRFSCILLLHVRCLDKLRSNLDL